MRLLFKIIGSVIVYGASTSPNFWLRHWLEHDPNNKVYTTFNIHPSTIYGVFASLDIIHCRLGYPSLEELKVSVPRLLYLNSLDCESCRSIFSKQCHKRYMHVTLWYCWLWCLAPSRVSSTSGYRYYVTFIDDFSRWT